MSKSSVHADKKSCTHQASRSDGPTTFVQAGDLSVDEIRMIVRTMPLHATRAVSRISNSWRHAVATCWTDFIQRFGHMNELQLKAFVHSVAYGRDVFVTGGAGVGKSYVGIRIVFGMKVLRASLRVDNLTFEVLQKKSKSNLVKLVNTQLPGVSVTAPTGCAAQLLGGYTCHCAFGISIDESNEATSKASGASSSSANKEHSKPSSSKSNGKAKDKTATDEAAHEKQLLLQQLGFTRNDIQDESLKSASVCVGERDGASIQKVSKPPTAGNSKHSCNVLAGTDVAIIDEVSMLRRDTLDAIDGGMRAHRGVIPNPSHSKHAANKDKDQEDHDEDEARQPKTHNHPRREQWSKQPFGGAQMVLLGDFYQLPPVVTKDDHIKDSGFAFKSRVWRQKKPQQIMLIEVMRQDPSQRNFVEILNRTRIGRMEPRDASWLQDHSRVPNPLNDAPDNQERLELFRHKEDVRECNRRKLNELTTPLISIPSTDSAYIEFHSAEYAKQHMHVPIKSSEGASFHSLGSQPEPSAQANPKKQTATPDLNVTHTLIQPCVTFEYATQTAELCRRFSVGTGVFMLNNNIAPMVDLKAGCRVRSVRNIYTISDGVPRLVVFNGQTGTFVEYDGRSGHAGVIWDVAEKNSLLDAEQPAEQDVDDDEMMNSMISTVEPCSFERRVRIKDSVSKKVVATITTVRDQLPLEVCFAKTIHKAQGMTIDYPINVNLAKCGSVWSGKPVFAPPGIVYTALSRVKTISLLRFTGQLSEDMIKRFPEHCNERFLSLFAKAHPDACEYYAKK